MVRIGGDTPKPTKKDSIPRARAKREHTVATNVRTNGQIGLGSDNLRRIADNSWNKRTGEPDIASRPAPKDKPCCNGVDNPMDFYTSLESNLEAGMYAVDSMGTLVKKIAGKTTAAKQPGIFASFFNKLRNTSTDVKYPQAVDMSKFKTPDAKEAAVQTTRTVANLMKTDAPTEVGNPEDFADNVIYVMNPKGDGKTVTVDQAVKYFTTVDRDSANPDAKATIQSIIENLADTDGNIPCDKLKTALKSAVTDKKTSTEKIYAALTNAGLEKSLVGKDGKSYFLRMSPDGNEIKMYRDDNGEIGQEVPFDQSNFLE